MKPDFMVVGVVYFAQGSLDLAELAKQFLLKDELNLPPADEAFFLSLSMWPWFLKPVWGFIADAFPIFSSHRRSYLFMAGLASAAGWVGLGTGVFGVSRE